MRYEEKDTIVAVATARGTSPRAIIRLSGPQALRCVLDVFIPETYQDLPPKMSSGQAVPYNRKYAGLSGQILVEDALGSAAPANSDTPTTAPCLLYIMRSPHSYTKEDVVEIHTIGSPPLLEMILETLFSLAKKSGLTLRLAEPGEFTKRAFLNGRIDLSQAEAVLRVIRSKNDTELRLAARQLGGETSRILKQTQERLAELLSLLELALDFSDQDIELVSMEEIVARLDALYEDLAGHQGEDKGVKRDGIRVVFYGPPGVGKSSLFNALLGRPRAITSPHPGTTRDTLEAELNLMGLSFCLTDTAGVRESSGIEALAIVRTQKAAENADLTLLVLDSSRHPSTIESFYPSQSQTAILVINKSDQACKCSPESLPNPWQNLPMVYTSALTGMGLEKLRQEMVSKVLHGKIDKTTSLFSSRQRLLLKETLSAVERALKGARQSLPREFIALELRAALDGIGEVCGTVTSDDILGRIFSQFCIGK